MICRLGPLAFASAHDLLIKSTRDEFSNKMMTVTWFRRLPARLMWRFVPHRFIAWVDALRTAWVDFLPEIFTQIPNHNVRVAAYRMMGAKIGANTSIHRGCKFYNLSGLKIASNTVVNQQVVLDARCGLSIGENVSISETAMLYTLQHDIDAPDFRTVGAPVIIEDYVFIGPRAIILPGVRVGTGAAVGAGAVVTKDVLPFTVVGGVPAHFIRGRNRSLTYTLNYRRPLY